MKGNEDRRDRGHRGAVQPSLRSLRFLVQVGLGVGLALSASCSTKQLASPAGAQDSAPATTRKPTPAPAAPATTAPVASKPDAGTVPAKAGVSKPISREELVKLLLDPSIRDATPEQTASRFAPVGDLARSSMFPDQLDLHADGPTQRVVIEYVQGKSGFQFSHLGVALWSAAPAELKAGYDAIDAQLAKALGKPQWTKKVPDALPNRAYRVGKKLSLVLGEGLEKGKGFVRLELSEPQGERD